MNKKALLLLIPFAAGTLVGCTPKDQPKTECDSAVVHVDKESASMKVGDTLQLNATIDKEGCSITWSSSAADIASVDSSGIVTANAVGTANIIANGKTVCVVTVTQDGPGPVNPKHAGTLEDPYDNADALLVGNSLPSGEATEQEYYIKGKVAGFEEDFNPTYGNYSFSIEGGFICWRLKNGPEFQKFEEGDIEIGDEVIVFAKIQKYHKDGQPDKPETKDGYVHSVKKDGPQEPSLKLDKTEASLKIGKTMTITATVKNTDEAVAWSIEGTAASMVVSGDNKSVTLTGESVGSATVKAKLNNAGLEESCVVSVSEPAPVGQGAVYTFVNDKESAQNWSTIGEDGFKKATVCEGEEIITGYKDGENAYIGGNGGSGDTAWNIWNCLKVGKSGSQGKITIKLDSDLSFESIKISAIGARDDGTLVVNGTSKDVTKKATKDDLEPMVLEYDIGGGISELTLTSKPNPGSKENFGICITRIEFVGRQEAVLESISADITKKSYEVGDELSLDGLTVTGHYSDGNDAPITEGITTSLEAGHIMDLEDTSLTVYVGEIHTDIALTVTDPTLVLDYITIAGVKTQYYAGQTLGDVTVTAHYIGGTELDVTSSAVLKIGDTVVSSDHIMALGESKIVATYEDETDEIEFTVVEDTVTELIVATNTHREFNVGADFVPEKINALYVSGKVEEDVNATFDGYDMDNAGEQTVTVEFGGASTTYDITVSEVQREALPYKYTISGGKLAEPWVADPNAGTNVTSFSSTYINIKQAERYIEAQQLINPVNEVRVTLVAGGNGNAGSILTVAGLNDKGELIEGASGNIAVASKSSLTVADLNDEATYGATVTLKGTGITGFRITLSTRVANTVVKSIAVAGPAVKVSSVTLDEHELNLEYPGSGATLTPTVLPDNADNKEVEWTVSGSSVSVVDGVITTIGVGDSTVTATAKDGSNKSDSCVVHVAASSKVLESIAVTTHPSKNEYFAGETFDPKGMVVTAYYEGGDSEPIEDYSYPTEALVAGQTSVTISYGGKTAAVAISVVAPKGSTVDNPFSVAEVIAACAGLGDNEWLKDRVYVQGTVKGFAPSSSNKYTLTDGENDFIVYKSELPTDFDRACIGDTVVMYGWVENYHPQSGANTLEMTNHDGSGHSGLPITAKIVSRGTSTISLDSSSSANATVTFEATATNASEYSFTVAAKEGYKIASVKFDGTIVEGNEGVYTVKVMGNAKILVNAIEEGTVVPTTVSKTITDMYDIACKAAGEDVLGKNVTTIKLDDIATLSTTGKPNCGLFGQKSGKPTDWRLYQNQDGNLIVTAAAGYKINTIKVTYNVDNSGALFNGTTQVKSNDVVTVNGTSITLTVGNTGDKTNGQVKVTAIEVIYVAVE